MAGGIFKILNKIIPENRLKNAKDYISKGLSIAAGVLSTLLFIGAGVFFIAGFTALPFFFLIAIVLFIPAVLLAVISGNIKSSLFITPSTQHYRDIKTCKNILGKIKQYIKGENLKKDFYHIYKDLKNKLKEGQETADKIESIRKTMKASDWNAEKIDKQIEYEKSQASVDKNIIKKLNEQKDNIKKLKEREELLRDRLSNLRLNFNSIYTKLTLLDTHSKEGIDEIEGEIQKVLDFKLKTIEYENELKNELE